LNDVSHPIRSYLIAASAIVSAFLLGPGCASGAYGPEADERLSAAINDSSGPASDTVQSCADLTEALGRARNAERPEGDRLRSYMQLYHDLEGRIASNKKLFDRQPELVYGGGHEQATADAARAEQDRCVQMNADTGSEFELLVRDLFQPLIITDLTNKRRVARVSFILLRSAVQELALTDSDSLLERIGAAEKAVGRK
jgi:hypothetical protein